jgi:hypothetical protein
MQRQDGCGMWIKVKYAVNVVVVSQRLKFSLKTTMNLKRQGIGYIHI